MLLIYLAFGWAVGLMIANSYPQIYPLTWLVLSIGLLVVVLYTRNDKFQRRLFLVCLFFGLGGLRFSIAPQTSELAAYNGTGGLTVEGIIVEQPDVRDDRVLLTVDVDTVLRGDQVESVTGAVLVRAPRTSDAQYGDRVRVTGLLLTPQVFDVFSYADYLARQGIFSVMRDTAVEVMSSGHGYPWKSLLINLRQESAAQIARYLPEPQSGLLTGILLGDESSIAPEVEDAFSVSGAAHVIAISGFNMVLISAIVMRLLNQVVRRPGLAAILGIVVIVLYTLFVGANGAVFRAAIMSIMLVIAEALRRKTYLPASLAFALVFMTVFDPNYLWDVSFQLSFFATLGIALFVDPLSKGLDRLLGYVFGHTTATSVGGFLSEPLVVTLASLITTTPLIILYFQRFSLVAIPVNLLIVPVQSYILVLGAIALLSAFVFPAFAQIIFWLTMIFLSWTISVVRTAATFPLADVEFNLHPYLITLFFAVILGWAVMSASRPLWWDRFLRFLTSNFVLATVFFSSSSIALLMFAIFLSFPDGQLHVWFLDVGHSNAVLMQTPNGAQILVDGGRYPSRLLTAIGDRIPFNDRDIDVLFITHPDEFDTGALPALLDRYGTALVLTHGQPNQTENYNEIQTRLADRLVTTVTAGYNLDFNDEVQIEVLHPQFEPAINDSLNDNVLVIRVSYGDVSFLLTSDVSAYGQSQMLEAGHWPLATVFQVPQHGTARALDQTFVDAIQPSAIVIQSDRANFWGDPDMDTLAMLPDAPIYRTDESGTLHFWTDGTKLWVQPEK